MVSRIMASHAEAQYADSASARTATFAQAMTPGSVAVVCIGYWSAGSEDLTVVGSVNGAYTKAISYTGQHGSQRQAIWYKLNTSSSAEVVTVTPAASAELTIAVDEYLGVQAVVRATSSNAANSAGPVLTGTIAASIDDLIVVVATPLGGVNATFVEPLEGVTNLDIVGGNPDQMCLKMGCVLGATGSLNAEIDISQSALWGAIGVAFRPTATALKDSLVGYWKLNESSAGSSPVQRNDAHSTNHLGDAGNTPSTTGLVYSLAANLALANSNVLYLADNAALSLGANSDLTVACWVKLATKATTMTIVSKGDDGNKCYLLFYDQAADRFRFRMWETAGETTPRSVPAATFGSPSTGTWYFIVGWRNTSDNVMSIQVNNGVVDTGGPCNATFDDAGEFDLGAIDAGTPPLFLDGVLGPVMIWKRVLAPSERTALYNGGAGKTYETFDAGGFLLVKN